MDSVGQTTTRWKKTAVSISIGSLIVSVFSLIVSWQSSSTANLARADVRAIERLDLDPKIAFYASLNPEHLKNEDLKNNKPFFKILNISSIDALQVNVQFINICIDVEKNQIGNYGTSKDLKITVGDIEPLEEKEIFLTQNAVNRLAKCGNNRLIGFIESTKNQYIPAVLVWITYKRDPDRKIYITRAVYFEKNKYLVAAKTDESNLNKVGGPYNLDLLDSNVLATFALFIKNYNLEEEKKFQAYEETYTGMILNYSEKINKFLEPNEWDAVYPLDIESLHPNK